MKRKECWHMSKSFTNKEVKAILAEHKSIKHALNLIESFQKNIEETIIKDTQLILDSTYISDQIVESFEKKQLYTAKTEEIEELVSALYQYTNSRRIAEDHYNVSNQVPKIDVAISALSIVRSPLKWLFASKTAKQEAEEAYSYLKEKITDENYGRLVKKNLAELERLKDSNVKTITDNNAIQYKSVISDILPQSLKTSKMGSLSQLLNQYHDLVERIHQAKQRAMLQMKEEENVIKRKAEFAMAELAVKQLNELDVELLNQEKSGIRTKSLRDAGYKTIGDIYCASVYNLVSVYGISEETAYLIKGVANDYRERIQRNIKLNVDREEQTKGMTDLLSSVFAYKRLSAFVEKDEKDLIDESNKFSGEANSLNGLNNISWYFSTLEDKEQWHNNYQAISDFMGGDFPNKVTLILTDVTHLENTSSDAVWNDFSENSIEYLNIIECIVPGILGKGDTLYGLPEELAREIQDQTYFPQGLKVTLRRYQEWGVKYILHQERVLLGDEMGLGKTIQALATMVSLRNTGAKHFLVVCPASVLPNWCKEIERKSEFRVTKIHGSTKEMALADWIWNNGVAVTTYETTAALKLKPDFKFDLLVVDEAHYIKNENARRSQNVRKLGEHTKRILLMTGTALENKVDEMISLIQILQPGIASQIRDFAFMSSAPQFREQIASVYYRRKREDVLTELPEITETKEWCELLPEEEAIYETSIYSKNRSAIRKVSWVVDDLAKSSKAQRMKEIIEEAEEDGRKVLVFSFYLETIAKIKAYLGERCTQPINGSVSVERRQEIIENFDEMPAGSVLLAQIQAGGTGLNIQAASVVIICEPQLKPSIENQAISRAYRMGQTRKVLVYHLLSANTIDERIDDILERKQDIFNAFADKSVAADATVQEEQQIDD
ncbi:MAG: DEAD/DEAH box helicase, partial [Clostridia bacterium]|nr:DEAD/DEAH box helicase [Clostridia bacterium]